MKQALFILAAFLLVAPNIVMGQDFEVVSPADNEIFRVVCSDYKDSLVEISNNTNTDLLIKAEVLNTHKINLRYNSWLVPKKTKTKLLLVVSANFFPFDTGTGKLRFYTNTHSDTVNINLTYTNAFVIGGGCQVRNIAYTDVPVGDTVRQVFYAINNLGSPVKCSPFGYEINNDKFVEFIRPLFDTAKEVETGKYFAFCEVLFSPKQPNVSRGGYAISAYFKNNTNRGDQLCVNIDYLRSVRDPDLFNECFTVNEKPLYHLSLIEGGKRDILLFVKNNRPSNKLLHIDSIGFKGLPNFSFLSVISSLQNTTIPFIPKQELYIPVTITANSYSNVNPYGYMSYSFTSVNDDSCTKSFDGSIGIRVILPTAYSIVFPVDDNPYKEVLAMKSSAPVFRHTFHFQNTTDSLVKVDNIFIKGDMTSFILESPVSYPLVLSSGDSLNVVIKYQGNIDSTAIDSLLILSTNGDTTYYEIQALRTTTSGVLESSETSVAMMLRPNPAKSVVTVAIKGAGLLESAVMVDELGKEIYAIPHSGQHEWKWDLPADRIPSGNYFIRVTGKAPDGKPFVSTKRLVVQ